MGAIVVIALFYTNNLVAEALFLALFVLTVLIALNVTKIKWVPIYVVLGIFMWYFILKSGIHATIAGVLLAFTIPLKNKLTIDQFLVSAKQLLNTLKKDNSTQQVIDDPNNTLNELVTSIRNTQSPLFKIEHRLKYIVAFIIVPVFALANSGIQIQPNAMLHLNNSLSWGIMAGLVLGKPLGIVLFAMLAIKLRWAQLPTQVSWRMMWGLGILGGIGFTMSLFIADLAFNGTDFLVISKLGILLASLLSTIIGYIWLKQIRISTSLSINK